MCPCPITHFRMHYFVIILLCVSFNERYCYQMRTHVNKYFELKNSWGTGAPLNSNYLLATSLCMFEFNSSDSWGCSIADGLKDTSQCHRLLGFQEFQVPRPASHPVKAPLPNCQNALLVLSDLHNTMNEDVHVY